MTSLPPVDLLEATHVFPGRFTFKAIGKNQGEFTERVVATIRVILQHEFDSPFSVQMTSGGRHVSVTIEPTVESADQVVAIYQQLRALDGLVMLL